MSNHFHSPDSLYNARRDERTAGTDYASCQRTESPAAQDEQKV